MDLGALTTFFYGLRDRERILDIFEESFGSRLLHSFNYPGGLMHDVHRDFQKHTKEFITYFRKKLPEYDQLLSGNVIFRQRSLGIGRMSRETAIAYGITGPSARASGVSCDLRKLAPYSAYRHVKVNEILDTEGDTFARYKVRIEEMRESMNIIEQLIDNIPSGEYTAKMKPVIKLPVGEYFQRVETARGEFAIYVVSDGNKTPYRMKFRTPNFSNLFVLNELTAGGKIADLVAVSGSLDLVIPDIDR
jgi:NADH-quinone oxidoreductase subunit D/NADH-quinone oxidoreductase subunit C/D